MLRKTGIICLLVHITSAIVHLNGLLAAIEPLDHNAVCITPDDTTSAVWDFSMV